MRTESLLRHRLGQVDSGVNQQDLPNAESVAVNQDIPNTDSKVVQHEAHTCDCQSLVQLFVPQKMTHVIRVGEFPVHSFEERRSREADDTVPLTLDTGLISVRIPKSPVPRPCFLPEVRQRWHDTQSVTMQP